MSNQEAVKTAFFDNQKPCILNAMEEITSLQNKKIKEWTALHHKKDRDRTGMFLIEGEHLIEEALNAGIVMHIITDTDCPFSFPDIIHTTSAVMNKLSANVSGAHLIGVCHQLDLKMHNPERILLLDNIQDPGNLGTLIRTAVSFSFDGVALSEETCDLYNEKTIRSTQGAMFHIPVYRKNIAAYIEELQKQDFKVIATCLKESHTFDEIPVSKKMAFVMGNEGNGVSEEVLQKADDHLRIEMHGFESLNVAVAGGIVMYMYKK